MKRAVVNQRPIPSLHSFGIGGTTPDGTDEWTSNPPDLGTILASDLASMFVPLMTEDVGSGLWYVVVTGDGDAVMTEVPL